MNDGQLVIYISYPGGAADGAAGDLISLYCAIQAQSKFSFEEINKDGRVVFLDSIDGFLKSNKTAHLINYDVKKIIVNIDRLHNLKLHTYESIILNSHHCSDKEINHFLNCFEHVKIIRILPKNKNEEHIRSLMMEEKHSQNYNEQIIQSNIINDSLLDLGFGDILIDTEETLRKINKFLDIKLELANPGIFDTWKSKQPGPVKKAIKEIYGVDYG